MTGEVIPFDPIATEIDVIRREMGNPDSNYHQTPHRRARYLELLVARDSGKPAPAVNAVQSEKQRILKLMSDQGSEYWTGPGAGDGGTVLQRRYREIIAIESGEHSPTPAGDGWRKPPVEARKALNAALVSDWDKGGQFDTRLRRAQDVAGMVVSALGTAALQLDFVGAFEGLGKKTQSAILRGIAMPEPAHVRPADDGDMSLFKTTDGADQTIALWGSDAQRRVGLALDRFKLIEASLTPAQHDELSYFWWHCTPRERQLVMWSLGS